MRECVKIYALPGCFLGCCYIYTLSTYYIRSKGCEKGCGVLFIWASIKRGLRFGLISELDPNDYPTSRASLELPGESVSLVPFWPPYLLCDCIVHESNGRCQVADGICHIMHGKKYIYSFITYSLSINSSVFLEMIFIYLISAFGKKTLSNLGTKLQNYI